MGRGVRDKSDLVFGSDGFGPRGRYLKPPATQPMLDIKYNRSRWSKLDLDLDVVDHRRTAAWISWEGQHIGSIELFEYHVDIGYEASEFLDAMDDHSQDTANLAAVVCAHWEDPVELMQYGPIVELRRAWANPATSRGGRFASGLNFLLDGLFARRALLILKAFPLEYEGSVSARTEAAFRRRRSALMRYYSSTLGVQPLPSGAGAEGWMYVLPKRLAKLSLSPACHEFSEAADG